MDPQWYLLIRHLHMLTAVVTTALFLLRLGLDTAGRPGWRQTPLRILPHVNDTLLLATGIALVLMTAWMPLQDHWLTLKLVLLVGYIVAGKFSLDQKRSRRFRAGASVAALGQLGGIFGLAVFRSV